MKVKILTDSGCDISEEILKKYDIDVMALNVLDGDLEYLDKETIKPRDLYKGMREGKLYQTSQVSPEIIWKTFEKYAKMDKNLIYICFSSGLSGQYQTANLIYEEIKNKYPDFKLKIIDSKAASIGMGLMVEKAGKMAYLNKKQEDIVKMLEFYIKNMVHIILVDNMNYLYRGGRINKVQALAGNLLSVKPILTIDSSGKLEYIDKVRGRKKLFKKVNELIKEYSDISEQKVGLVCGDNEDLAEDFIELLMKFNPSSIEKELIGASVSAHTGPDMIGITFLKNNYTC